MEYRLNKIDTDARRKIIEKTKEGKVHKLGDLEEAQIKENREEVVAKREKINVKKRYLTIDGIKDDRDVLQVDGEIEINKENSIGTILDKKG